MRPQRGEESGGLAATMDLNGYKHMGKTDKTRARQMSQMMCLKGVSQTRRLEFDKIYNRRLVVTARVCVRSLCVMVLYKVCGFTTRSRFIGVSVRVHWVDTCDTS